jgi:hypothetical protein
MICVFFSEGMAAKLYQKVNEKVSVLALNILARTSWIGIEARLPRRDKGGF